MSSSDKPRAFALAAGCWLAGCSVTTVLGSDCPNGICKQPPSCAEAEQHLSATCDAETRTCEGVVIAADEEACMQCTATNERLHIANRAIVQCACAHCAAQLAACLDSATPDDKTSVDRDNWCRLIVECGWGNKCAGSDCYCGIGVDRVECQRAGNAGQASGPCASLIAQAAGCLNDPDQYECVLHNRLAVGSALYRATDVGLCVTGDPLLKGPEPACSTDLYELD